MGPNVKCVFTFVRLSNDLAGSTQGGSERVAGLLGSWVVEWLGRWVGAKRHKETWPAAI